MDTAALFGHRVRQRRHALALTQAELATRMAAYLPSGHWNRAAISKIEHGQHNPSQRTELALAAALDVSMAWLWGAEPPALLTPTQRAILHELALRSETAQVQLLTRLQDPPEPALPAPATRAARSATDY